MRPVGACLVPRHAEHEWGVVAVVSGPPWLANGQDSLNIMLHFFQVKARKGQGVVKRLTGERAVLFLLVEDFQLEPVWEKMVIVGDSTGHLGLERTLAKTHF